jgi:hypothetical protein
MYYSYTFLYIILYNKVLNYKRKMSVIINNLCEIYFKLLAVIKIVFYIEIRLDQRKLT